MSARRSSTVSLRTRPCAGRTEGLRSSGGAERSRPDAADPDALTRGDRTAATAGPVYRALLSGDPPSHPGPPGPAGRPAGSLDSYFLPSVNNLAPESNSRAVWTPPWVVTTGLSTRHERGSHSRSSLNSPTWPLNCSQTGTHGLRCSLIVESRHLTSPSRDQPWTCAFDCYDDTIMMRTQITLYPEEHRRARHRAAEQGISLAEYIRRLVSRDLEPSGVRGDISAIFGLGDSGGSEIATHKDEYVGEAVAARHRRR